MLTLRVLYPRSHWFSATYANIAQIISLFHYSESLGLVKYNHYGGHYKGIDMRAEVGILTRNVRVRGDMEPHCYGQNWCQYFTYDTFGGHLMVSSLTFVFFVFLFFFFILLRKIVY